MAETSADTAFTHVDRLPLHRETSLGSPDSPAAAILVPDDAAYQELGRNLAEAVMQRTGIRLDVLRAADFVGDNPKVVKPDKASKHFILLGQYWNNAALERLYAAWFDPADAFFPGPGGFELRTVCRPFFHGHNCVVVTGSDVEGCRKAVAALPDRLQRAGDAWDIPFLHEVHLTGEAAKIEADYRRRFDPLLDQLDRYSDYHHPQAALWTGEHPGQVRLWPERHLAQAASFAQRYWATSNPRDAEAFKRLVSSSRRIMEEFDKELEGGKRVNLDYTGPALTIAWDLVEETDAFTDAERQEITDFLCQLTYMNRDQYFLYKCKDSRLEQMAFRHRHDISGTFWFGMMADYLLRNADLSTPQCVLVEEWRAHTRHYLERLAQTPFYSDGAALIQNEGEMVLRYALMTGNYAMVENGSLGLLADYFVMNHGGMGEFASNGICGNTRQGPVGGEILNITGWLLPGEGHQAYRRRLGPSSYSDFFFYMSGWSGMGYPYYNFEMPLDDSGLDALLERFNGLSVLPIGEAFCRHMEANPAEFSGGFQRFAGRYQYDAAPHERLWKRMTFRGGFEKDSQYLALDGLQGVEWSYDDVNSLVRYDDLGEPLLKSQWDSRRVENPLELSTLFVSRGSPGSRLSLAAHLLYAADLGPEALVASVVPSHGGVSWTRRVFWRKGAWFLFADEVNAPSDGETFLCNSWLSWYPFEFSGAEAVATTNGVTMHIVGTPDRRFGVAQGEKGTEGIRQELTAELRAGQPLTLWTLVYARAAERPAQWGLKRIGPNVVLVQRQDEQEAVLAFTHILDMGKIRLAADMGLASAERFTLGGCREVSFGGKAVFSSATPAVLGWNLSDNAFELGKQTCGLSAGAHLRASPKQTQRVAQAANDFIERADEHPGYVPSEATLPRELAKELPVTARLKFATPVSLAAADLDGAGNEQLLMYLPDSSPRFIPSSTEPGDQSTPGNLRTRTDGALVAGAIRSLASPVAVDFDGTGKRDIVVPFERAIAVYHPDGTLRWRHELNLMPDSLCAGDLDGDGREEVGIGMFAKVIALDRDGNVRLNEEVYGYSGIACGVADVDGDGRNELVVIAAQCGPEVFGLGKPRRMILWKSPFGNSPCRLWLRDLDGDGIREAYAAGGGAPPACYDLRPKMRRRWASDTLPIPPRDAVLCDVDGDGALELVCGGDDGFLYVTKPDGTFMFSKSLGAAVTALAAKESGLVFAGLASGRVMQLGRDLKELGSVTLSDQAVRHLGIVHHAGEATLYAADDAGLAVALNVPGPSSP